MLNRIKSLLRNSDSPEDDNEIEQIAVAAGVLLIEIARADDDIAQNEIDMAISHLKQTFQSSPLEFDDVFAERVKTKSEEAISLHEFTALINKEWDNEKKSKLLKALWRVAGVDNKIDKYEEYYIRKIKDLLYLSDKDFIQAKIEILNQP